MKRIYLALVVFMVVSFKVEGQVTDLPFLFFYDNADGFPFVMDTEESEQYTDRWALWYGLGNDINNQICGTDGGCATLELDNVIKRRGTSSYKITLTKNQVDYNPIFNYAGLSWKEPAQYPVGVRWAAFSVYLPTDYPIDNTPLSIFKIQSTPGDTLEHYPTPFEIVIWNDHLYCWIANVTTAGVPNGARVFDLGVVQLGGWMDFVLNRNFTQADSGYVKLYKNGQKVVDFNGPNWLTGGSFQSEGRFFVGINKWTWEDEFGAGWGLPDQNGTIEIWYDEVKFGSASAKFQHMLVDGSYVEGNVAPLADAGTSKSIKLPTSSVIQTGSGSDADGSIGSYLWEQVAGPITATIANPTNASTAITGLTAAGSYLFRLTVFDNLGSAAFDDVPVTVILASQTALPPAVNSAPNFANYLPRDSVRISAEIFKQDGFITSATQWRFETGPPGATVTVRNDSLSGFPTYNKQALAMGLSEPGLYKFRIDVYDNSSPANYVADYIYVTIIDSGAITNQAPRVDAGADRSVYLPTTTYTVTGTLTDDRDGIGNITHVWRFIGGPATPTIADSSELNTMITFPGFGTYNFILMATDQDGATGSDQMKVTVFPDNRSIYKKIIYKPN